MARQRLAVGLTPMETRRPVVLHVAQRAEEPGVRRLLPRRGGGGHDAAVLLAEIVATRTSRITLGNRRTQR
jgi:hypothetical protein